MHCFSYGCGSAWFWSVLIVYTIWGLFALVIGLYYC